MEWISSKQLMDAMGAPQSPAWSIHAQRVCKRAHAGLLRARAKRYCVDDRCDDDVEVPASFWWAEGHEALEQDWESGDFETWEPRFRHNRFRAFGVHWCKEDAEEMGVNFDARDCYLELSDLEQVDRDIGERWAEERLIRMFDAALWVGSRNPQASATLAGFRAFQRRQREQSELAEGAAEYVGLSLVPEGTIARGKALLLEALRTGAVTALGSTSPDGSMEPIRAAEWARPFGLHKRNGTDCLTGPKLPWPIRFFDLMLDAATVFRGWPPSNGAPSMAAQNGATSEGTSTRATKDELRTWVVAQIEEGKTQTHVERQFRNAVPGKIVKLNRDAVREIYDQEYHRLTGERLRSGPRR